jgi:signal transduction histidine kinase/ligand-binding sensor domain-containing protein
MIICLFLGSVELAAQNWSPFVNNFNTEDYNAALPNIVVQQDNTGLLFFGNLSGLLIHDGVSWEYNPIENGSMLNELFISKSNQIYFASNNKFGYLTSDLNGEIGYQLLSNASQELKKSRIKDINQNQNGTYFLSEEQIIQWKNDSIYIIPGSSNGFQKMFSYNNSLFVKERGQQLQILNDKQFEKLAYSHFPTNNLIITSFNVQNQHWVMSFPDIQFYGINSLLQIDNVNFPFRNRVKASIPYRALYHDSTISISTRKNGVFFVDIKDTSHLVFNENENLNSNISAGLSMDTQSGLWVATQKGIARIEPNKAWFNWNKNKGLSDFVVDIIRFENILYVSTTKGLFFYKNTRWIKIKNFDSKAFYFKKFNDQLLLSGLENGLFKIKGEQISKIGSINNAFVVGKDEDNNLLVPSDRIGLLKLSKNLDEEPVLLNRDLNGTSISFEFTNDSTAWLSMKWEGLYLLNISDDTATYTLFDQKYGLPDITEINIIPFEDEFIFTTSKGFYQLNANPKADSSNLFIPSDKLQERGPVVTAAIDDQNNVWYATRNRFGEQELRKLAFTAEGKYVDKSVPLKRLPNQTINQIYPDPIEEGVIWIAGSKGLYRYDENVLLDTTLPFNTFIRKVSSTDSVIFHGYYTIKNAGGAPSFVRDQPENYIPTLAYQNNNIKLQFSSSAYTLPEKNEYSYTLKGLDNDWSKWSRSTRKEYSNLSPGTYTFKLRSKNLYGTEGEPTFYTFTIIPPWYLTNWAIIIFILIGLAVIWFIILLYSYRLRLHRKHLKLLIADRTFEVMAQKKEIEHQYLKLSEQTEEILHQSEQIEFKNQDLEQQQEEILTINNQLEEMNFYLEKKVEKRTAKIKSTLDKLKQTNKELDTFIYKASHDLKGPLSRILGLAGLAKIETPTDKNIQYLEMIESTSRDMDLLLSKLTQVHELFNQKPKIVPLLIEEILEDVKVRLNFLTEKRLINILLKNRINEPIKADHQLFYTVIFNLVENAILFRNYDSEEIHEITVTLRKDPHNIAIEIKDNGIGIEEDLIDAIFDMFYRASDQSKGSGLGLYLVKIAIDKMHGEINVESRVGKGTIFTLRLPL